jgi:hypothetical protein
MVSTAGLLDWNEKVAGRTVPGLFRAVAVNPWICPTSTDTFRPIEQTDEGAKHKLMLAGTGF